MNFTKMHGTGNDYIYINCFEEKVANPKDLAISLSHRRFGIGSDGLILIKPGTIAEFRMDMYNGDGSWSEMCGNGLRCVAKYIFDNRMTSKKVFDIETGAGIRSVSISEVINGSAASVRIDMGEPITRPSDVPILGFDSKEQVINEDIRILDRTFKFTAVSMGNPHCVIFLEEADGDIMSFPLEKFGHLIENHSFFPSRVNVEFVKILSRKEVRQRTWERGSAETFSCGTGACAVLVAGILNNLLDKKITNHLKGGDLELEMDDTNHVFLSGPAVKVFEGKL